MLSRMKMPASKGGSSSNHSRNPRKSPVTQSPPRKWSKKSAILYSLGKDATSLERYNWVFSYSSIIMEQSVNAVTLHTTLLTKRFEGQHWMSFSSVFGPTYEEAVHVFYMNMFEINDEDLSFWIMVCNTPVQVSPTILSTVFGAPHPSMSIAYPIHHLTMEQKGGMVQNLCGKFVDWPNRLPHK